MFSRLTQKAQEVVMHAEKTPLDPELEELFLKVDKIKPWVASVISAVEPFVDVTTVGKITTTITKKENQNVIEKIGQSLRQVSDDSSEFPKVSSALNTTAIAHTEMGLARKEFNERVHLNFIDILKNFISVDIAAAQKKKSDLEKARLTLDSLKAKIRSSKAEEAKAKLEADLPTSQANFDSTSRDTKSVLKSALAEFDKLPGYLRQFAEAEKAYYEKCLSESTKLLSTL